MVYFREHQWLLVHGYSHFHAYITPQKRTRDDVLWFMNLRYIAGGAIWRRVHDWERPSLWIEVNGFKPHLRHWTDLERMNFWQLYGEQEDTDEHYLSWRGGWLDVDYYPQSGTQEREHSMLTDHIWRVGAREGGFFTVELAGFADGTSFLSEFKKLPVGVTPEGNEEPPELDSDFVKKHAELYLVEHVPFGTVTVCVPRNARDVEAYALGRARELVGVGEPEHIDVRDFYKREKGSENIQQDIYVELHFNGYFED